MMQAAFAGLALLLMAACAAAPPSPSHTAVCTFTLTFPSQETRSEFIRTNATKAAELVHTRELYLQTDASGRSVFVYSGLPTCSGVSLDERYGLRGADERVADATELSTEEAITRNSLRPVEEDRTFKCVVAFPMRRDMMGWIMATLPHVGVRVVHMGGADGTMYVGADDDCGPVRDVSTATAEYFRISTANEIRTCPNANFQACGYPD